jgi:hypothetical protein
LQLCRCYPVTLRISIFFTGNDASQNNLEVAFPIPEQNLKFHLQKNQI